MLVIDGIYYKRYELEEHANTYSIRLYGKSAAQEIAILINKRREFPVQTNGKTFNASVIGLTTFNSSHECYVNIKLVKINRLELNSRIHTGIPPRPSINCDIELNFNKEGNKMLKIEDATLVNGMNADSLSEGNILEKIEWEEKCIEKISTIKANSKALSRIKEQHESNIKKLVKILDSHEG